MCFHMRRGARAEMYIASATPHNPLATPREVFLTYALSSESGRRVCASMFGRAQTGTACFPVYGLGWLNPKSFYEAGMNKISQTPKKCRPRLCRPHLCPLDMCAPLRQPYTVSFHNFKSQNFKLSVSNPKNKYVAYLSVLSQISNCQSLGRKNKHEILKTDRTMLMMAMLRITILLILLLTTLRLSYVCCTYRYTQTLTSVRPSSRGDRWSGLAVQRLNEYV